MASPITGCHNLWIGFLKDQKKVVQHQDFACTQAKCNSLSGDSRVGAHYFGPSSLFLSPVRDMKRSYYR